MATKKKIESAAETDGSIPAEEPRNVAVEAFENHTKIRGVKVAKGPVDFALTASEAKALAALGLVRITGIFG